MATDTKQTLNLRKRTTTSSRKSCKQSWLSSIALSTLLVTFPLLLTPQSHAAKYAFTAEKSLKVEIQNDGGSGAFVRPTPRSGSTGGGGGGTRGIQPFNFSTGSSNSGSPAAAIENTFDRVTNTITNPTSPLFTPPDTSAFTAKMFEATREFNATGDLGGVSRQLARQTGVNTTIARRLIENTAGGVLSSTAAGQLLAGSQQSATARVVGNGLDALDVMQHQGVSFSRIQNLGATMGDSINRGFVEQLDQAVNATGALIARGGVSAQSAASFLDTTMLRVGENAIPPRAFGTAMNFVQGGGVTQQGLNWATGAISSSGGALGIGTLASPMRAVNSVCGSIAGGSCGNIVDLASGITNAELSSILPIGTGSEIFTNLNRQIGLGLSGPALGLQIDALTSGANLLNSGGLSLDAFKQGAQILGDFPDAGGMVQNVFGAVDEIGFNSFANINGFTDSAFSAIRNGAGGQITALTNALGTGNLSIASAQKLTSALRNGPLSLANANGVIAGLGSAAGEAFNSLGTLNDLGGQLTSVVAGARGVQAQVLSGVNSLSTLTAGAANIDQITGSLLGQFDVSSLSFVGGSMPQSVQAIIGDAPIPGLNGASLPDIMAGNVPLQNLGLSPKQVEAAVQNFASGQVEALTNAAGGLLPNGGVAGIAGGNAVSNVFGSSVKHIEGSGGQKGCGSGCCGCVGEACGQYFETKAHIEEEFRKHRVWLATTFFRENLLPAMMRMAEQLTVVAVQQVEQIGRFLDAKHQLESQRILQQLTARAHRDYTPSEGLCVVGTHARGLALSEADVELSARAIASRAMSRQLRHGNSISSGKGSGVNDPNSRLQQYWSTYCHPADNSNSGVKDLCKSTDSSKRNMDIDYTRAIETPLTFDMDFTPDGSGGAGSSGGDNKSATPSDVDVFAISSNLYGTEVPTVDGPSLSMTGGEQSEEAASDYLRVRSVIAKRSVAINSFASITAMKVKGTLEGAEFLKATMKDLGYKDDDIKATIGEQPSYFAQMEILTKKLYQSPNFYTQLYDKPVNVARKGAALQAIGLMQDRDIYRSLLRSEAILSILLENALIKEQKRINASIQQINNPSDNQE